MNMIEHAKAKGARPVTLKLERHPIYAHRAGTNFKQTTVEAYLLDTERGSLYFWGAVIGSRETGSNFINATKSRFLIIEETERGTK